MEFFESFEAKVSSNQIYTLSFFDCFISSFIKTCLIYRNIYFNFSIASSYFFVQNFIMGLKSILHKRNTFALNCVSDYQIWFIFLQNIFSIDVVINPISCPSTTCTFQPKLSNFSLGF